MGKRALTVSLPSKVNLLLVCSITACQTFHMDHTARREALGVAESVACKFYVFVASICLMFFSSHQYGRAFEETVRNTRTSV